MIICWKKIPNKYELTIVTGKRVRELASGEEALVKVKGKTTNVQLVLKEIMEEKIVSGIEEEVEEEV